MMLEAANSSNDAVLNENQAATLSVEQTPPAGNLNAVTQHETSPNGESTGDRYSLLNELGNGLSLSSRLRHLIANIGRQDRSLLPAIVIGVITVSIFLAVVIGMTSHSPLRSSDTTSFEVCDTGECVQRAVRMMEFMEMGADPCVDFYQYACGNFPATFQVEPVYNVADFVKSKWNKKIADFFYHNDQLKDKWNVAGKMAKNMLHNCIFYSRDYKKYVIGLSEAIVGLFNLDFKSNNTGITKQIIDMTFSHDIDVFYQIGFIGGRYEYIYADINRPDLTAVFNDQETDKLKVEIAKLNQILPRQTPLYAITNKVESFVEDVRSIAAKIAENIERSSRRSPDTNLISALKELSPTIEWSEIAQTMEKQYNFNISYFSYNRDYISRTEKLIRETPREKITNYFIWKMLSRYNEFISGFIPSSDQSHQSTFSQCLQYVETSVPYGFESLVEAASEPLDKAQIRDMIKAMDESPTNLDSQRDFPTIDSSLMEEILKSYLYSSIELVEDNYFQNIQKILQITRKKKMRSIHVNSTTYKTTPFMEVYSNGKRDSVILKRTAFTFPLYDRSIPTFLNLAGLGSLIYENIAAILIEGKSPRQHKAIHRMRECFENKFQENLPSTIGKESSTTNNLVNILENEGIKESFNRKITSNYLISEAIALRQTYLNFQAMKKYDTLTKRKQRKLISLPGIPEDEEQQVFLAFAQARCQSSEESLDSLIQQWETMPHKLAINSVMKNSEDFQKAFGCRKTTKDSCHTVDLFKYVREFDVFAV